MAARRMAYDNIRLLRRKIGIAQDEVARLNSGAQRDAAVMRLAALTDELVRALQDFADLGYEEEVAEILSRGRPSQSNVVNLH